MATLNAYGLSCEKLSKIQKKIKKEKIWITFLCETWATPSKKYKNKNIIAASAASKKSGQGRAVDGVALIINDEYLDETCVKIEKIVPGLAIKWKIGRMTFVGVYLPPRMEDADCIALLQSLYEKDAVFLGDLNARFGEFSDDVAWNTRGGAFINWFMERGLTIVPMDNVRPTFMTVREGRVCKSIVDYFVAPNEIALESKCEVLSHPGIDTDHRMICCSFQCQDSFQRPTEKFVAPKRFNLNRLKNDHWKSKYKEALEVELNNLMIPEIQGEGQVLIDYVNDSITNAVRTAAVRTIGEVGQDGKESQDELPPEIKQLLKMRKRAYKAFTAAVERGNPEDITSSLFAAFVAIRKEAKRAIAKHRQESWMQFTQKLLKKPVNEVLKMVKSLKSSHERQTCKLDKSESNMELYRLHYERQFMRQEWQRPVAATTTFGPLCEVPSISQFEVLECLRNAPKRKAPGPSGIPNELLVPYSECLVRCVTYLFDRILNTGMVPTAWKLAHIYPVPKKGDLSVIGNYRPISLTENLRKLFERVIAVRVRDVIEPMSIEQGGFRRKRSTLDQVATLQEMLLQNRGSHIAFLDIKAAYDSVDRSIMWRKLQDLQCPHYLLKVLQGMFDENTAKVVLSGAKSEDLILEMGVLQGSILSPLLYAMYIDDLPASLGNVGVDIGGRHTSCLMYADDIAIVSKSAEDLRNALETCEGHSIANNYRFNPAKCAVISSETFVIYGEDVPLVESFVYLGIPFRGDGVDWRAHAYTMAAKVVQSVRNFGSFGVRSGGLPDSVNARIYKSFIRPKMEYGLALLHTKPKSAIIRVLEAAEYKAMAALVGGCLKANRMALRTLIGTDSPYERSLILRAKWVLEKERLSTNYMVSFAIKESDKKPMRKSCFYHARQNPLVLEVHKRLFVDALQGKRTRVLPKKSFHEIQIEFLATRDRQLHLPYPLPGDSLRSIDLTVDPKERRPLILWILRKCLKLPMLCPKCGESLSYDHVASCMYIQIDENIALANWKVAAAGIRLVFTFLSTDSAIHELS